MGLFISIGVPLVLGLALIKLFLSGLRFPLLWKCALGYGLGMGLLAQWILLLDVLGIPFSREVVAIPLLLVSFILVRLSHRNASIDEQRIFPRIDLQSRPPRRQFLAGLLMVFYIVYQIYYVFWKAMNIPIYSWDTIYFIAIKAKVFFYEGNMKFLANLPWPFYPLQSTMAKLWTALSLGYWDDQLTKLTYPCIFLSYLIIQFYFLWRYTSLLKALLGVVLLCSSGIFVIHGTISYNDLFMSYFLCSSILSLFLWFETNHRGLIFIAALLAGCTSFCKLEGLGYMLIVSSIFLLMLIEKKTLGWSGRLKNFCLFVVPAFAIYSFYTLYKIYNQIPMVGRLYYDFSPDNFARLLTIVPVLGINLLFNGNWNIVWFLLFVSLINYRRFKMSYVLRYLGIVFVLFFGFLTALALLTSNYEFLFGKQDNISLSRLILHFFPLATIMVVLLNHEPAQRPDQ